MKFLTFAFFFILFSSCVLSQNTGQWAWISGSTAPAQAAVWGTKGIPAAANTPGAKYESMEWVDTSGNFWLFGGWPISPTPFSGHNGDLWKFDPKIKQWAWMHGTQTPFTLPVYGIKGIAAPGNMPTAYCAKHSVADNNGNLWLPITSNENIWKYNTNSNMWTWVGGSGFGGSNTPRLGTKGIFSATNNPNGTTENACSWDHNNYIYSYNYFYKSNGQPVGIMWKYNVLTNQWAWVAGDTINGSVYGTRGVASSQTQPGAYWAYARWKGGDGNFYMMGGIEGPGISSNSLWKFDPTIDQWTWLGGAQGAGVVGNYGTMGVASPTNWPGSRVENRVTWVDKCGNLWLYGGSGYGVNTANIGNLNDLWMYSITSGMWTWKGGTGIKNVPSTAGTQNVFSPTNQPSGRNGANGFVDKEGNFWLFGGADTSGFLNDMWMLNTQPSVTANNATACLSADGSATVKVLIGEAPYTYVWSSGHTTSQATITGLMAGAYTVSIIDAGGCIQTDSVGINSGPNTLSVTTTSSVVACDNHATAVIAGGASPYTYSWSNSQTVASATGLTLGTHTIFVADKNGCTITDTINTLPIPIVSSSANTADAICYGQKGGSASVSASGGIGNYFYWWGNGETTSSITGLTAGIYSYTVTDQNGCTSVSQAIVSQPSKIIMNSVVIHDTCASAQGQISIITSGGTGSHLYSWNNGSTESSLDNLASGKYFVSITDSVGCIYLDSVNVFSINPLQLTDSSSNETCENTADGEASVNIQHGKSPYSYSWSNGQTNKSATGLSSGIYTVTVTDVRGCVKEQLVTISSNPSPTAYAGENKKIKRGDQVQLSASGGILYLWTPLPGMSCSNCADPVVSPSTTTTYYLTVVDNNGCTSTDSVTIEVELECEDIFIPNVFSPNNDGQNDVFKIYGNCVKEIYIAIYNQWGEKVFEYTGKSPEWNGIYNDRPLNTDVFTYNAQIVLLTGEVINKNGNINLLR